MSWSLVELFTATDSVRPPVSASTSVVPAALFGSLPSAVGEARRAGAVLGHGLDREPLVLEINRFELPDLTGTLTSPVTLHDTTLQLTPELGLPVAKPSASSLRGAISSHAHARSQVTLEGV